MEISFSSAVVSTIKVGMDLLFCDQKALSPEEQDKHILRRLSSALRYQLHSEHYTFQHVQYHKGKYIF